MSGYIGIIKNGCALLSTLHSSGKPEHAAREGREAERARTAWRAVYPGDQLEIVKLERRDAKGWEVARR